MRIKLTQYALLTLSLTLLINSPDTLWGQSSASQPVTSSGTEFMVPQKLVNGKSIGQEEALIQEVVITDSGRQYRRLDVGVSGTLEGWVVKEGARVSQFISTPEFAFTQTGNSYRRFHGILRYEASKGTGMTIIYPEAGTAWNKKLFVNVHGSAGSFRGGSLEPWNQIYDPGEPFGDIRSYERAMLDKGYAIAKTRRNAASPGDNSATLDNGEILEEIYLNLHTDLILGFAKMAENLLKVRLGEKPLRTYWYGHSSGGMIGRFVNYAPGENIDENGELIIDGFINHDAGSFLPVLMKDGEDVLFVTEAERRDFANTIEITHLLNLGRIDAPGTNLPHWMAPVHLINKRMNAKILKDKGLGNKTRMYEVRGVSHFSGRHFTEKELIANGISPGKDGDVVLLDLSGLVSLLIDLLDNWVEKDIAPPATKSDWLELSDIDGDGVNEDEAIVLPEVACPLGLYYPYPQGLDERMGRMYTGFATFDGQSLEPLDGRGVFVDMNLNRYLDPQESVDQAWHRLGLLKPGETFSRSKYQACVEAAVDKLKQEKLITERVAARYVQQASGVDFPGQ